MFTASIVTVNLLGLLPCNTAVVPCEIQGACHFWGDAVSNLHVV